MIIHFDAQSFPDLTNGKPLHAAFCVFSKCPHNFFEHFLTSWHKEALLVLSLTYPWNQPFLFLVQNGTQKIWVLDVLFVEQHSLLGFLFLPSVRPSVRPCIYHDSISISLSSIYRYELQHHGVLACLSVLHLHLPSPTVRSLVSNNVRIVTHLLIPTNTHKIAPGLPHPYTTDIVTK